jgi:uncharacterized protein YfbU (UPF0304 family)
MDPIDVKDRLVISNQFKILAALYPDDAKYYDRARKVFEEGYELLYDWFADHIYKPMNAGECNEVFEILQMHGDLLRSYGNLTDKSAIDEDDVAFRGFDGNNEGKQLGLLAYLIKDEGKYEEFKNAGDGLNSHMPTLEMYRRMLPIWRSFKHKFPLEKADIQKIIAEQIHPENR